MFEGQISVFVSKTITEGQAVISNYGGTILLLSIGIATYAAIVGTFYNYISRRLIYETKPEDGKRISGLMHRFGSLAAFFLQYTILFPAITFLWFALLSLSLFLLTGKAELENIFLLSISIVVAIRALAYYKESIAVDLAKMLPLALLGFLIVDHALFTRQMIETKVLAIAAALPEFASFIAIAVILEWSLRILYSMIKLVRGEPAEASKAKNKKRK